MKTATFVFALISGFIVLLILLFLGYFSIPIFKAGVDINKVSPLLISSIVISFFASVLAFVFGLSVALFIESFKKSKAKQLLGAFFALLGSIPTVVYGFLGVVVVVKAFREFGFGSGYGVVSAILVLSLVVTPTIVLFLKDSFSNTPKEFKSIVKSLGGTKEEFAFLVLLPYNKKGLLTAYLLGFARAIGDTMIALMVAGNSINYPTSFFESVRTLTANIALLFAGDFDSIEFRYIFICGLILFLISAFFIALIKKLGAQNG
jgi:phosphate transport system permease protein